MLTQEVSPPCALQDCTICMERLVVASGYEGVLRHKGVRPELVGRLGRCGHMYHLLCLVAMYSNGNKVCGQGSRRGLARWGGVPQTHSSLPGQDGSLQCPTCKAIYGEKTGTQPPGKMEFHLIPHSLPGFGDTQTIRIVYDIPTGIQVLGAPAGPSGAQPNSSVPSSAHTYLWLMTHCPPQGPEHPNPGKKFTARGFPRHCYLPNNEKGRKVSAREVAGECGPALSPWARGLCSPQALLSHSSSNQHQNNSVVGHNRLLHTPRPLKSRAQPSFIDKGTKFQTGQVTCPSHMTH